MDVKVMMEKINIEFQQLIKDDTSISQILFDDVSVALTIVKLVLKLIDLVRHCQVKFK